MKLLLALLLVGNIYAASGNPITFYSNMATTNLSATYTANPQLIAPNGGKFYKVDVITSTTSPIIMNCSEASQPSASRINSDDMVVLGGIGYSTPSNNMVPTPLLGQCWFRSLSGTLSSGVILAIGWGY